MYDVSLCNRLHIALTCLFAVAMTAVIGCGEDEPADGNDEEPVVGFVVEIDDGSTLEVYEEETITVIANIENTGDDNDSQNIDFLIEDTDGQQIVDDGHEQLEVAPGSTEELSFEWDTEVGDAGGYEATVESRDDSASASVTVEEEPTDATLVGTVADEADDEGLDGVEVRLYDDDGDFVDSGTTSDDATYEISEIEPGDYQVGIQAPGLHPDFELQESDDQMVSVSLQVGTNTTDLTVDWLRNTDVVVDGGILDFDFELDDDFVFEFPGCEQQDDGSWEAIEPDYDNGYYEVGYEPAGQCFLVEDAGIDIATGELDIDTAAIDFPEIQVAIDDDGDGVHPVLDTLDVHIEMDFDDAGGQVDFRDGSLDLDLDTRFLLGGNVNTSEFGTSIGDNDCQLTGSWGGDIADPQVDEDDAQIGEYLHDPVALELTTGTSGSDGLSGEPFDDDTGVFVTVDDTAEVDRLSEGELADNDPGGGACGRFTNDDGLEIDYSQFINITLNLPAEQGDVSGEFDLLIP